MPRHMTPFLQSCYEGHERDSWLPVSGTQSSITRFGGDTALARENEAWPMHIHGDGQPMSLVFQADTDDLPQDMQKAFGGAGKIFQLFLPFGNDARGYPRSWIEEDDATVFFFDLRFLSKEETLVKATCPTAAGIDIPQVPPRFIASWERRVDFPFSHGGPYAAGLEDVHQRFDDASGELIDTLGHEGAMAQIYHEDDRDEDRGVEELTNEWGTKIGGWPSLEQGPRGVDETIPHILQICGQDTIGNEAAYDGHGWLCRSPEGEWIWYTVMG